MDDNNVSNVIPDLEEFQVDFDEVVNVGGGTSDFNQLTNRPKYDGQTMTGNTNIPKVPEKTSDLNNDSDYQTGTEVQEAINDSISQINIPTKTSDLTNDGADGTSTYVEADDLATVATTGSYNDLSNKPNIPTVNDATLTINQNGVTKGTFTANDSNDEICDLTDTTYTAGTNVQISAQNEISATDTTYSNFTGTDGTAAGTSGLVPAPATTDAGKFLKADGTWDTAGGGGGPTVVQTTGTSTTDVMSQDATTKMIFPDIANSGTGKILIGSNSNIAGSRGIAINSTQQNASSTDCIGISTDPQSLALLGSSGRVGGSIAIGAGAGIPMGNNSIAIGKNSYANGTTNSASNTALGANTNISGKNYCVALGYGATPSRDGEMNVGAGTSGYGYNSTNYRVIGGVHDPVDTHDAATKNYVDSIVINYATLTAAGAPTTSTAATSVGQLYYDSTNDDYYYCSAIDTTDPNNPVYTWSALSTGGGGGPTVVQATGTSTTDVMSQKASSEILYGEGAPGKKIALMNVSSAERISPSSGQYNSIGNYSVLLAADWTYTAGNNNVLIGAGGGHLGPSSPNTNLQGCVAIGYNAENNYNGSVSLGSYTHTSSVGEVNIGSSNANFGYNNTNYRLITGVHDGQSAQDAVTVNQVNATIDAINTALSINIPHIGAAS